LLFCAFWSLTSPLSTDTEGMEDMVLDGVLVLGATDEVLVDMEDMELEEVLVTEDSADMVVD